jgi:hypothetical protein
MGIISGGVVLPNDGVGRPILKASAFASNDFAGSVVVGGIGIDTTNGKAYICTATNGTSTSTWVVIGAQT